LHGGPPFSNQQPEDSFAQALRLGAEDTLPEFYVCNEYTMSNVSDKPINQDVRSVTTVLDHNFFLGAACLSIMYSTFSNVYLIKHISRIEVAVYEIYFMSCVR
jgi:hypothetical protein